MQRRKHVSNGEQRHQQDRLTQRQAISCVAFILCVCVYLHTNDQRQRMSCCEMRQAHQQSAMAPLSWMPNIGCSQRVCTICQLFSNVLVILLDSQTGHLHGSTLRSPTRHYPTTRLMCRPTWIHWRLESLCSATARTYSTVHRKRE